MKKDTVVFRVLKRIRSKRKGWVFTPKDLLDLGTRTNIGVILHNLVIAGKIKCIARSLYYYPKTHPKVGVLSPSVKQIASAITRSRGDVALPDGAKALNMLGLSAQVPAKNIFFTNFTNKSVEIGNQKIQFITTGIKCQKNNPELVYLILQALAYLGPKSIDSDIFDKFSAMLSDSDKKKLMAKIPTLKGRWFVDTVRRIAA